MSGHSKWANIKHRKGAQDAKRAKIFQKLATEILVAAKSGTNLELNPTLRLAIEKAKSQNMPNDNIKRLLEKNAKNPADYHEVIYEGYGPSGVAILVDCLTDNIKRTAAYVKSTFNRGGGNLGTDGSVAYLFKTKGIIIFDLNENPNAELSSEQLIDWAIEHEVLDIKEEENFIIIEVSPTNLVDLKNQLIAKQITQFVITEVKKIADRTVELSDEKLEKLATLIEKLEESDDVQNVYTNANY